MVVRLYRKLCAGGCLQFVLFVLFGAVVLFWLVVEVVVLAAKMRL